MNRRLVSVDRPHLSSTMILAARGFFQRVACAWRRSIRPSRSAASGMRIAFMTKRMLLGLVIGACFLGVRTTARAEEEHPPQPYVVLVGIDKYQDAQIKPRKHAEADAQALYDLFTSKQHLGV